MHREASSVYKREITYLKENIDIPIASDAVGAKSVSTPSTEN